MAIKKVQHTAKHNKETKKDVPAAVNLEEQRRHFQESVKRGGTARTAQKTPGKHHTHVKRSVIIAVAALLVVIGTACMAYLYFWAQTPQKVVVDSLLNALSTPSARYDGTIAVGNAKPVSFASTVSDGRLQLSSTAETAFSGDLSKMTMSLMATESDLYFKIDKASRFIEVTTNAPGATAQSISPEVKKQIDNRWTVLNKNDYQPLAPVMKLLSCSDGLLQKVANDRSARAEIMTVYSQHPFLQITETTSFTAATGEYRLSLDDALFSDFIKALGQSPLVTASGNCKNYLESLATMSTGEADITVKIDKASRTLKSVQFITSGATKVTIEVEPIFKDVQEVRVPADAVKFDEINSPIYKQYVQATLQQLGQVLSVTQSR